MRSVRNEIKNIMRAATILAALFAMTFVLAGNASAVVIGPLGNQTVLHAPIGAEANLFGVRPAILKPAGTEFFRPNPFVRVNPFFRPSPFVRVNPFFRPNPFNNFFGVDRDDFGFGVDREDFGFGFRERIGEDD